ncbi:hypothetical protein MLD38_010530 [Melastoma candidum]|uniref:Uncharacterized protein n=1 Tax=Melastoma candidum TaxID=119954 RepID=A0ACB9R1Z3_9MYRT|nr:hypothetical protein MLD38_010530 [Melastoma candidum]
MEFSLSGNALKTFSRAITCLSRVANDLAVRASPSQLAFHTINSSRSAYQLITFKQDLFDSFSVSGSQVQFSLLLKAACSVLRTPISNIDSLTVQLPDPDASKVKWILNCLNGIRKTYWITCNVDPEIQHLSLDRRKYPSDLVVRPRDLTRLLSNFQSSLQEITVIATERSCSPADTENEYGGKAVEFRSYLDPTKENDSLLHTQLWIDPAEEFVLYNHKGNPVDITFGVKELKAFLAFCEGGEVDMHLYFDKAGEPILMAPKFGIDDGTTANFDATLVLATMLVSQLHNDSGPHPAAVNIPGQSEAAEISGGQQEKSRGSVPHNQSNHTKIWSDLSGSAARNGTDSDERRVPEKRNQEVHEQREIERISSIQISRPSSTVRNELLDGPSQCHPSNWVNADESGDDENEDDDGELYVQPTPPYLD